MLHPLGKLLKDQKSLQWQESDLKYLVQEWLRRTLLDDNIVCDEVGNNTAHVRVSSAILNQEVRLHQHALSVAMKEQAKYELKKMKISTQS